MHWGGRWWIGGMTLLLGATSLGGEIAVSAPRQHPDDIRPGKRYTYSVNKLPNNIEKLRHIARYEFILRFGTGSDRALVDTLDLRVPAHAAALSRFYDEFFKSLDPNPLTPRNEFDSVLDDRINYCQGARRKCFHLNDPGSTVILPLYDMLDDLGKEIICKGIPLMEGAPNDDDSETLEVIFPVTPGYVFCFAKGSSSFDRWRSVAHPEVFEQALRQAEREGVNGRRVMDRAQGLAASTGAVLAAKTRRVLNTGDRDRLIDPETIRAEVIPVPGPIYFDEYQALINVFVRERVVEDGKPNGASRLKVQYAVYELADSASVLALDSGDVVFGADTTSERGDLFFQLRTPCFWRQTRERRGGEYVLGLTITRPDGSKWKWSEILSMDAVAGDPPTERAMVVSPPPGTYRFFDQQLPTPFREVAAGDTLNLWFPVKGIHYDSSAGSHTGIVRVYLTPYIEGRGYAELGPLMLADSVHPEMLSSGTPPRVRSKLIREIVISSTHANSYQVVTARVPNDLPEGRYTVAIEVVDPTGQKRHPQPGHPQPLQWAALTLTVREARSVSRR